MQHCLKNLTLFRPQTLSFLGYQSDCELTYHCYSKCDTLFNLIEELIAFARDSRLEGFHHGLIAENRVSFFTVSLSVPVEQGLLQGYKALIIINLILLQELTVSLHSNVMFCGFIIMSPLSRQF